MARHNSRVTLRFLLSSFPHRSRNPPLLPSATATFSSCFTTGFDEKRRLLQCNIVREDQQVFSFFKPLRNFIEIKQWGVGIQRKRYGSLAGLVQRNPRFSKLNDDDVRYFEGILGNKNVVQDEDKLVTSNTDWMHKYKGSSKLLLQPRTTDQVLLFFYLFILSLLNRMNNYPLGTWSSEAFGVWFV